MRWLKFIAKRNMDDCFTFVLYVIIIALFTFFAGYTLATISYENECKSILNMGDEAFCFEPYELDYKPDTGIKGITWDAGVIYLGDILSESGEDIFTCSDFFLKKANLNLKYKSGNGFTNNPDEVIVIKGSGYKVGDEVQLANEEGNTKTCEVVGILKYPVFFDDITNTAGTYSENDDYDGIYPYAHLFTSYISSEASVLFLNPRCELVKDSYNDKCGYLFADDSKTLKCIEEQGDIENINALKNDKEDFLNRDEAVLDICLFILFICGIVIHNYFNTKKGIREYGIYFMLGITKIKMYLLLALKNSFSFIVGFLLGSSFLYRAYKMGYDNMLFKMGNQLQVLLVCFGLYIVSIIPVLIEFKRLNIVQLISDKE